MKKVFSVIKTIFTVLIAIIAIAVMVFTLISATTFNRNDRSIFGYKLFIVLTDSMKATDFAAGDIVIVKNVDPTTLGEGDIIAFTSQNRENFGSTVTHKIRNKTTDEDGNPAFTTYGTTTNKDDETVVTYPYINGKYVLSLPKVGTFFYFLKSTPGYILCILVPFLILILIQGLNTVKLFRRYRKEQLDEIKSEREQLQSERERSEEIMAQLMELKAQLASQKGNRNGNGGSGVTANSDAAEAEQPKDSE